MIRWFSDAHLLDRSKADDFSYRYPDQEKHLISFIEDTYNHDGLLIVGGDLLDLWQASIGAILWEYKAIIDTICRGEHVKILGNHDYKLPPIGLNIMEAYIFDNIITIHGHQWDKYNKQGIIIGRIITWLLGKLERRFPDIDIRMEELRRYIHPELSDVVYPNEAYFAAKSRGAKAIIFEHTHRAGHWRYKDIDVFNTGTWTNGRRDYLEYNDGEFELKTWNE